MDRSDTGHTRSATPVCTPLLASEEPSSGHGALTGDLHPDKQPWGAERAPDSDEGVPDEAENQGRIDAGEQRLQPCPQSDENDQPDQQPQGTAVSYTHLT